MADGTTDRVSTRTTLPLIGGLLALALAGGALALHAYASETYTASSAPGTDLDARYERAYVAAAIEPWNPRFVARRDYVAAWLRADTLLAAGDYKDAVTLLSETIGRTLAEPDLLALYREAQRIQTEETNRKAHLQHGHEGPGGTLTPADIER